MHISRTKQKVGIATLAALLVAGGAGVGALVTADSTVAGNQWKTQVVEKKGVIVSGTPFDATLSAASPTAYVDWTVDNQADVMATVSALFDTDATSPAANYLHVKYEVIDDATGKPYNGSKSIDGGTIGNAQPVALGQLSAHAKGTFRVTVTYDAEAAAAANVAADTHVDNADFKLDYMLAN